MTIRSCLVTLNPSLLSSSDLLVGRSGGKWFGIDAFMAVVD